MNQEFLKLVEKLRLAGLGRPDISCRGQDGLKCECSICRHNAKVNKAAKDLVSKVNGVTIYKKPNPVKEKATLARVKKQCSSCSKWDYCTTAFKLWSDKCSLFTRRGK